MFTSLISFLLWKSPLGRRCITYYINDSLNYHIKYAYNDLISDLDHFHIPEAILMQ